MPRGVRIAAILAISICSLLLAQVASGATLTGDYQLQGTLASSGSGPALTDLGAGNSFQNDTVMGSSRQVLAFPLDGGVEMDPAGVGTGAFSVVTTFRFDDVEIEDYRRVLDSSDGTISAGFYTWGGGSDYYYYASGHDPVEEFNAGPVFSDDVYATAVLTVTPPSESKFYVDGALQLTATEGAPAVNDTLRLFNESGYDSAGAVSCIRVYSGTLSDSEVAAIGTSATCGTVSGPPPAPAQPQQGTQTAKKKCKKHKKKHKRAADTAKKKKCKKKKKR